MTYMTIREAAEKWDLTPRRVQQLCKSGEIEGAVKEGRSWLIREDISYQVKRLHTAPGEAGRKRPAPFPWECPATKRRSQAIIM